MYKILLKIISLLTLVNTVSRAQEIGEWESFASKNEIVNVSSIDGNQIWCASTGGAFMYERSSGSFLELSPSEGLSSPLLTSAAIDMQNQVWFGTQLGSEPGMLNVYNFQSGAIKKINDIYKSDYTQKAVKNISVSGDTVLVSTEFGLALLNPINYSFYDTFLKFGAFDALRPVLTAQKFNRFFVMLDDGIAVQKSNSTNLSAPESWLTFQFGEDLNVTAGHQFVLYNGSVLSATSHGIYQFGNNNWQQFLMNGVEIQELYTLGSTLYFVANENDISKIYSFNGSTETLVYENSEEYTVTDLYVAQDQTIYAGTNLGLLEISSTGEKLIYPEGPANNAFASLAVDNDGVLWVGTGRDVFGIGAMYFDGENWGLINRESNSELPSDAVHQISVGPDNTKYFCNWGNGITYYKDGNLTTYNNSNTIIEGIPDAPTFVVITDAEVDSKGHTWLLNLQSAGAYPLSLIRKNNEVFNFEFTNPRVSGDELAFYLEVDQFDTKWFAITTGDLGLYYFNENGTNDNPDDDDMGIIRASDGLQSSSITALELDRRGSLWVGTNVGVSIIPNPSSPRSNITTVNALRQQSVSAIVVDPLNQKWIATVQGLFHLSEDGIDVINQYTSENSPIPTNDIKSLAFDDEDGILYIGTDFGLTALKTSSLAPQESMDKLFVYPNPVLIAKNMTPRISVEGLIENTTIKVLSISGEVLREFITPGGSIAFWDGKDDVGNIVPSGIYLLVAYDEDGSNVATGKVAIIRE